MTDRDSRTPARTVDRIKAALGTGILGLSLCGMTAGLFDLTWQMPQQCVVAAISITLGWLAFGR